MSLLKSDNTAGGLAKLFLLRLIHFQGFKWSVEYQNFVLNDVSNYLEQIYFTQDTGSFAVTRKSGAYNISIKAVFPGSSTSFDELEGSPFLLVGLTHNKEYILFGDKNNFFIYDYDQDSGADFSELHQTAFNLKRKMMMKPRLIRDPFIEPTEVSLAFDVYSNLVYFSEVSEGLYQQDFNYYINPSHSIQANIFCIGPCNFKNRAIVTFELYQAFASGNFAPVSGFAQTIDPETLQSIDNHSTRYAVEYSSQQANEWVTVTIEIWSDTPPFNALYVYLSTKNVGVAVGEYAQMRNFTVQTLP